MGNGFAGLNGMLSDRPAGINSNVDIKRPIAISVDGVACRRLQEPRGCHAQCAAVGVRHLATCRMRYNKEWRCIIQRECDAATGEEMTAMQRERSAACHAAAAT